LKILLVRPRLIGDVILTTPTIRALRRRFPEAEILYLVEALAAPVVAANPHISETIVIRHRRGWRRLMEDIGLAVRLRARRVDVAVDFHAGPRSAWLTWATRARVRVGYDVSGRQWMYTHLVSRPRGYLRRHSVHNQWTLLAAVDEAFNEPPDPDRDRVEMPIPDAARTAACGRLREAGVPDGGEVVVVHAAAGNEFRRWAPGSFAAVAGALIAERAERWIVMLGGPADWSTVSEIVDEVRTAAGDQGHRIVRAVGWPLEQVRALMERAALFIGGDSGPMHIAATTDVPIVALFGPTLPVHWAPWRPAGLPVALVDAGPLPCRPCDQRVCEPGDFRCLTRIGPDAVVAAARRLLEARA
jgi:predicted lipopolysaccharide heptosyltransferase III